MADFVYVKLGRQKQGAIVEAHLSGNAANVFLMDSTNFSNYKSGRRCKYYGGHTTRTPVYLQVPSTSRPSSPCGRRRGRPTARRIRRRGEPVQDDCH